MTISSFSGEHRFLSNFYTEPGLSDRLWGYPTTEHAFQAAKTLDKEARLPFKDWHITPGQAKRMGRKLVLRHDWGQVKNDVMLIVVKAKFTPGTKLADRLLATGSEELVEGNSWHDNYWGICSCDKCGSGGQNMLGLILMLVRANQRDL